MFYCDRLYNLKENYSKDNIETNLLDFRCRRQPLKIFFLFCFFTFSQNLPYICQLMLDPFLTAFCCCRTQRVSYETLHSFSTEIAKKATIEINQNC